MTVYRYYYGASPEQGICAQAASPELERLPLGPELRELASMHALDSSEHSGETLLFLLEREGYSILGVSYIEPPKSSGYNRSAPCSLQYIAPMRELSGASAEMSRLINFVRFPKPGSASPEPLDKWPLNDSGYFFHNSPSVLAPLVDGMVRAALSRQRETLLIGLPKGKNSDYAFARYTIAELLAYLPVPLRPNIRFFTGLPAAETNDPVAGYDNAVRYGANVVFCPNEFYQKIVSSRTCFGVDMEAPEKSFGAFAEYISGVPDVSDGLNTVDGLMSGDVTYDSLNRAAQLARGGRAMSPGRMREELGRKDAEIRKLQRQIDEGNQAYRELAAERDMTADRGRSPGGGKKLKRILILAAAALILLAAGAGVTYAIMSRKLSEAKAPAQGETVPAAAAAPEAAAVTPAPPADTAEAREPEPAPETAEEAGGTEGAGETGEPAETENPAGETVAEEPAEEPAEPAGNAGEAAPEDREGAGEAETEEGQDAAETENGQDAPPPVTTTGVLQKGSRNANGVRELQASLQYWGYYTGGITGTFDDELDAAVREFQKANELTVDGKVGDSTRKKLNSPDAVRAFPLPDDSET